MYRHKGVGAQPGGHLGVFCLASVKLQLFCSFFSIPAPEQKAAFRWDLQDLRGVRAAPGDGV